MVKQPTRATLLKQSIRVIKKLDKKKPLTVAEFQILKKRGLIKGKPGALSKTAKGKEFVRVVKKLGFL